MQQIWRIYGAEIAVAAIAFAVAMGLIWVRSVKRPKGERARPMLTDVARAVLIIGAGATLYLTLLQPLPFSERALDLDVWGNARSVIAGTFPLGELVGNLLALTWLGWGLAALGVGFGRTVLVAAGVSIAIETLQYLAADGRVSSLFDVLLNTAGAVPAWLLAFALVLLAESRSKASALAGADHAVDESAAARRMRASMAADGTTFPEA